MTDSPKSQRARRADTRPQRTPKSQQTKEDLIAAARATFEERGYFETRVADIVRRAHVSHGTFYTYFDSKDDVLRTIVDQLNDDLFEVSTQPVQEHATPFLTLEATIRQFIHGYKTWAKMMRILEQAVAFSDQFLAVRQQIRDRFSTRLEAVIRAHQKRTPDPQSPNPRWTAYALGGMVDDFVRGIYTLDHPVAEDEAVETLALIWARAIVLPIDRGKPTPAQPSPPKAAPSTPSRSRTSPSKS